MKVQELQLAIQSAENAVGTFKALETDEAVIAAEKPTNETLKNLQTKRKKTEQEMKNSDGSEPGALVSAQATFRNLVEELASMVATMTAFRVWKAKESQLNSAKLRAAVLELQTLTGQGADLLPAPITAAERLMVADDYIQNGQLDNLYKNVSDHVSKLTAEQFANLQEKSIAKHLGVALATDGDDADQDAAVSEFHRRASESIRLPKSDEGTKSQVKHVHTMTNSKTSPVPDVDAAMKTFDQLEPGRLMKVMKSHGKRYVGECKKVQVGDRLPSPWGYLLVLCFCGLMHPLFSVSIDNKLSSLKLALRSKVWW